MKMRFETIAGLAAGMGLMCSFLRISEAYESVVVSGFPIMHTFASGTALACPPLKKNISVIFSICSVASRLYSASNVLLGELGKSHGSKILALCQFTHFFILLNDNLFSIVRLQFLITVYSMMSGYYGVCAASSSNTLPSNVFSQNLYRRGVNSGRRGVRASLLVFVSMCLQNSSITVREKYVFDQMRIFSSLRYQIRNF